MINLNKPPMPTAKQFPCGKDVYWFQENSNSWVCAWCHPNPNEPDPFNRQTFFVEHDYYKREIKDEIV